MAMPQRFPPIAGISAFSGSAALTIRSLVVTKRSRLCECPESNHQTHPASIAQSFDSASSFRRYMYPPYDSLHAVNRIGAAVRDLLNVEVILQTAADEVGHALNLRSCAVSIGGKLIEDGTTRCYLCPGISCDETTLQRLLAEVEKTKRQMERSPAPIVVNHDIRSASEICHASVPIFGKSSLVGMIRVESDDPSHKWDENELLLLQTVA